MKPYPIAAKRPYAITQHGVTRHDEYYWMCERNHPEALQYLQAENEYLEEVLQHIKPLREQLFEEMKGRIKESDETSMLQTNFSAGHAGASGRFDFLKENVLDFAFLIDLLT